MIKNLKQFAWLRECTGGLFICETKVLEQRKKGVMNEPL